MSGISYDGRKVNNSVENILEYSEQYLAMGKKIEEIAGRLLSTTGWSEVATISSPDDLSSHLENCKKVFDSLCTQIRQIQLEILKYNKNEQDMNLFFNSISESEWKSLNFEGGKSLESFKSYISSQNFDVEIAYGTLGGDTETPFWVKLATGAAGLVEGIADFFETGADFFIGGAGTILGLLGEKRWSAYLVGKAKEERVSDWFDKEVYGKYDCLNRYRTLHPEEFGTVRTVTKGMGYAAAMIVVGTNLPRIPILNKIPIIKNLTLPKLAGVMGASSALEDAYNDGANYGQAAGSALVSGVWETAQWSIGIRQRNWTKGLNKALGAAARVAIDTGTGAFEGRVIDPLKYMARHTDGSNFAEAFEAVGGARNVAEKATISGTMSALSEAAEPAINALGNTRVVRAVENTKVVRGIKNFINGLGHGSGSSAKEAAEGAVEKAAKGATGDAIGDAAEKAAKRAAGDAIGDAAEKAAKGAAGDAIGDATEKAAKRAAGDAAEKAAKGAAGDVIGDATEKAAKRAAGDVIGDATEKAAKGAAEDVIGDAAEKAAKGAAEDVIGDAAEKAAKGASGDVIGDAAEKAAKGAAGDVIGDGAEKAAKGATEEAAERVTKGATEEATEKSALAQRANKTEKPRIEKDALGGETKIWETKSDGKVTQRIVEGPTGKTTQLDYTYTTDANGNEIKETVSQTYDGKKDIVEAHVSSREITDANGNVSKEVYDANGDLKYTQKKTTNGNKVETETDFGNGKTSTRKVTTSVDNGKTIKDIEVADASGGTTRTRVTDTVDAAGNKTKTQVESLKTGYNDQNNKSFTSTVEYDATGHVKTKDIGMTEAVVNKRGETVFEKQPTKTVKYENNNGTTRKVTTDSGPKKKDVEINIKQRADANSDTQITAEKKYKDLNMAEREYVREQSKKYMKAESGKGFNKYSEAGRGELTDRYTRELALKENKMTPDIRTRAEEMADSVLGSKVPYFNSTNRAGKEALRQEGISDGMEKLIDNPLSENGRLIYGGKALARTAAIGLGGLGAIGAVGNAITAGGSTPPYQTLPPTTEPTTPTPPTSGPYPGPSPSPYPSGGDDGNNGGGDDGGNDNTPDTTPITTPITTPDTTPPTIPGDNGNNNSGGNNQGWNNSNGGYEPNPDESLDKDDPNNGDLSDEDKLPDDDNLGDTEDDSIYTIPTITNTDKKVTKDGINAIPILAGLGLAAAAGVGAKIYMDNKKNNDNGEEEYDDEFQSDSDYMSDSDFDTLSSQDSDLIADDWKEESAPQEGDESLDYEKPSFYSDTLGEEI